MWLTRMLLGTLLLLTGTVVDALSGALGSAGGLWFAVGLYLGAAYFFVLALLRGGDQWN